jgi:GxxExxY protein
MANLVTDATGNDLTYRIIGAAMAVHNALGPGYKEEAYERALAVELDTCSIPAACQFPVEVTHQGVVVALFMLDLFVAELVVVELKAHSHPLHNDELAQVLNYLKATAAPVGLLFNFGRRWLEYRRVFPPRDVETVGRLGRDNVKRLG